METSNQKNLITVLGATGKVGSQVLNYLSEAQIPSRAITRDLAKAKELPFVEWIQGDINNKNELHTLLHGSNKLFLNSGVSPDMIQVQNNIIDVAREVGVEHIIKLSTPAARPQSKDPVGEWHYQIQQHLQNSGLTWNILQPQSFMQNWLGDLARTIRSEKTIYSTAGNGKRAFTDTRDIGRVTVALFQNPNKWLNQIIPLSGNELVSFYDVAEAFSKALNQTITYVPQSQEEARVRLKSSGVPDFMINITLVIEFNQKTGVVEKLLNDNINQIINSQPFTIYDFAKQYSQAFK